MYPAPVSDKPNGDNDAWNTLSYSNVPSYGQPVGPVVHEAESSLPVSLTHSQHVSLTLHDSKRAAIDFLPKGTPTPDSKQYRAFDRLVKDYDVKEVWQDWVDVVQEEGTYMQFTPDVLWRLANKKLPKHVRDMVTHTVMAPGFAGITLRDGSN
jgi:hypothetical protein